MQVALDALESKYEQASHPEQLKSIPEFQSIVSILAPANVSTDEVLRYFTGDSQALVCAAGEALNMRSDDPDLTDEMFPQLGRRAAWADWFALQYLKVRASRAVVAEVLVRSENLWTDYATTADWFNEFLRQRREIEGPPTFVELLDELDEAKADEIKARLQST